MRSEVTDGTRSQLLSRKRDLFSALRLLEQDYQDGAIDQPAYDTARRRYEAEAAGILQQLDALPTPSNPDEQGVAPARGSGWSRSPWVLVGSIAVVGAIILFLVAALHPKGTGGTITGGPSTTAQQQQVSAVVKAAERVVLAHPRSSGALLSLGNAYLNSGDVAAADRSYQAAIKLAPRSPEPTTLHAMVLGSGGHLSTALVLLRQVERAHPRYAKAWLLDGLFSSRAPRTYRRAIRSWQRFLVLQPHATISANVRRWITGLHTVLTRIPSRSPRR